MESYLCIHTFINLLKTELVSTFMHRIFHKCLCIPCLMWVFLIEIYTKKLKCNCDS